MAEERGATFAEFVQGGLLDDADVTVKSARFIRWNYKGKMTEPVLGLQLLLIDAEGNEHDDVLSSGELKFFVPSSDGRKAIPVTDAVKSLNLNTNAVAFILSVMNADTRGELTAKLKASDDIGILDGLRFHMIRKDQPKRPRLQAPAVPGQPVPPVEPTKQRVECSKIIAYPWEAPGFVAPAATTAAAVAVAAAAPAAGNGAAPQAGPVVTEAVGMLTQLVATAGGSIKKNMIAGLVFGNVDFKAKDVALRNGILGMIVTPAFLGGPDVAGVGLKYDAATETVSF